MEVIYPLLLVYTMMINTYYILHVRCLQRIIGVSYEINKAEKNLTVAVILDATTVRCVSLLYRGHTDWTL